MINLPTGVFENFLGEAESLSHLLQDYHYLAFIATKEVLFLKYLKINIFLLSELCHSRKQFAAVDLQTQAFYAIVDQTLHGSHPFGKPVAQIIDDLCKTYSPATVAPGMSISMHFCVFLLSVDINPSIRNSSIGQIPVQCHVYCITVNGSR